MPPSKFVEFPSLLQNYEVSPVLAGYISALMPLVVVLCAPIAGLILDRWGRQLFVLLVANAVTIFAYFLLIQVIFDFCLRGI